MSSITEFKILRFLPKQRINFNSAKKVNETNLNGDSNQDGEDEIAEATGDTSSQSGQRIVKSAFGEFLKESEDEHGDDGEEISDDITGGIVPAKSENSMD